MRQHPGNKTMEADLVRSQLLARRMPEAPPPPPLWTTILIFSALLILYLWKSSAAARKKKGEDGRGSATCGLPIIGNLVGFLRNRHRFLDWAADLLSASPTATVRVRTFLGLTPPGICTADPAAVDHLLRANFPNYVKGSRQEAALSDLLGRGIFLADGPAWLVQRKIAAREFTTRSLRSFVSDIVAAEVRLRLLPFLSAAADCGGPVDLQDVLRRFAFDNICNLAFGTDPACLGQSLSGPPPPPFVAAFDEAVQICTDRLFSPVPAFWRLKRALNLGSERRLRSAIRLIDEYAAEVIASRRHQIAAGSGGSRHDLLSRFLACLEEDEELRRSVVAAGGNSQVKFLRDIVISFVLAGKDSTSAALTWFFWLLSENPRCERRIVSEIREVGGGASGEEYEALKRMPYLHAAVTEALRLYPPVPINSRVAVEEDALPDGTRVGKGWFADYSAYAMGRSERVWGADCAEYRPERWLDDKGDFAGAAEAATFPVFHAGPRLCLGREMAYLQMKAVAAAVLRSFAVEPVRRGEASPPGCAFTLTLKMTGGFPVRLRRRDQQVI